MFEFTRAVLTRSRASSIPLLGRPIILKPGKKLAMCLKLQFLEGQKRQELFKLYPPKTIYVFSARQKCALNGDFKGVGSSAVAYAWFVWEKGFKGDPIVKWI